MKSNIFLLPILFFVISFQSIDENYLILNQADFELMRKESLDPEIEIPDENFKSYNIWQCLPSSKARITKTEVDYQGIHEVPSIIISAPEESFSFDLDPDIQWDVDDVLNDWAAITNDSKSICIYGAYMQEINPGESLWYIKAIKTERGYWSKLSYLGYL